MSRENTRWGAPRIHGELLKLGFSISQAAVSKYMVRYPSPPSQSWRTFLTNHADCLASIDFFVVPTATFHLLFWFIVLHHERRQIVHFGVTANPTMAWVAQQIREAFPWGTAPRHLIRDRDGAYGQSFRSTVTAMGVEEVVTAPRSPWQNPYVERLIGSVRRECLDHSIILNERHLRRILGSYLDYYHGSRTHLSLGKDTPDGRPVQPAGSGTVVRRRGRDRGRCESCRCRWRLQRQLAKYKLLIIDELGSVPLSKTGAELLFEVFSQRYERGATLVTSNLPFDEWTEVFGSERLTGALLDRLTHHVHILEMNGESYRLNHSRGRHASHGG